MIIDAQLKKLIQQALKEDIGSMDITTTAIIHKQKIGRFTIMAKQDCVICGLSLTELAFEIVDSSIHFKPLVNDGMRVCQGKAIAYIEGPCRGILAAERTALNFLCWLSGISTLTSSFVEAVKGTKVKIMDTRKTIPTLRRLQKYAVKIGGGTNHRMGLYDQILIKDNHIGAAMAEPTIIKGEKEAIRYVLENAKKHAQKGVKIEIEVNSLDMLRVVLTYNPDIIMLDNMSTKDMAEAVKIRDAHRIKTQDVGFKALLEASGNINLNNVKETAQTGVDMISIGSLTHSAVSIDISLEPR
jgi:nicotinate-nucleotide pyrophosphorylase (carboxylating)